MPGQKFDQLVQRHLVCVADYKVLFAHRFPPFGLPRGAKFASEWRPIHTPRTRTG